MTSATVLSPIITSCQNAAPTVLILLVRSTVLLALGLLAARLLQRRGPVWTSAILRATLVCAIFGGVLALTPIGSFQSLWTLPSPDTDSPSAAMQNGSFPAGSFSPSSTATSQGRASAASSSSPLTFTRATSLPIVGPQFGWSWLLIAAWFSISLILILRLLMAQVVLARLSRQSTPATLETADILEELCSRMNVPTPGLRQSARVHSPFLAGLRHPCIYLPMDMPWDEEVLRAILLHEIAHYRRRDCLWNAIAYAANALLPIQPLLWLLRHKMEATSEQACDIEVVNGGCPAPAYAATLLRLSDAWLPARPQPLLVAGVVSFRTNLGRRIQVILSGPRAALLSRRGRVMVFAGTLVCTAAVTLLISTGSHRESSSGHEREWRVPPGYLAHFKLGQREGWSIGPVISVPREDKPWPPSPLPPPMVTLEQQRFIKELNDKRFAQTTYASGGPPESYRHFIETTLTKRPHDFYAEYRMAISYLESHDLSNYHRWLDMSLRDAPAVLVGRMQYKGGEPVVGYEFQQSIQLSQSGNEMEPRRGLMFYTILTDEDGCYYLPVYRATYINA
ncbi:MAG: M56 family metallopeptidase, partial [Armatimonadota bacterium]|nr:M56 family metallopeptidase [Armatimonadota bacterium]